MTSKTTTPRKSTAAGAKRSSTKRATSAGARAKTTPKAAAKTAAKSTAKPVVAKAATPLRAVEAAPVAAEVQRAKRPDLIAAVAERSDLPRRDVKAVMELVLDELGKILDEKDEAALQPLGKFIVKKRVAGGGGAENLTLKLKRPRPATGPVTPPRAVD